MYRYRLGHHGVAEMWLNVQSKALFIWQVYSKYIFYKNYALHRELWEGFFITFLFLISILVSFDISGLINFIYFNTSGYNTLFAFRPGLEKNFLGRRVEVKITNYTSISPKSIRNKSVRAIHTHNKVPFIWVYDITKLTSGSDILNCLVKGAPFKTKTHCASVLKTTRNSVRLYLDSNKILNNKWIISSFELSNEQLSKFLIPSTVWEVITGELLGDGYISYDPVNKPLINGRIEFTFAAKILHYVNYLKFNVLASICTSHEPTPWSNPKMESKGPTQYWFSTKRLPVITNLYQFWYKQIDGKYIKVLPLNIEELLTPLGLAQIATPL